MTSRCLNGMTTVNMSDVIMEAIRDFKVLNLLEGSWTPKRIGYLKKKVTSCFRSFRVENAIECGAVTMMFSKVNLKRKTTAKMRMRKLILKLEDKFSVEGEYDVVISSSLDFNSCI